MDAKTTESQPSANGADLSCQGNGTTQVSANLNTYMRKIHRYSSPTSGPDGLSFHFHCVL